MPGREWRVKERSESSTAVKAGGVTLTPRPSSVPKTKAPSKAATVAGTVALLSQAVAKGADAASYTETCSATFNHQPPWDVWDWTMIFFLVSIFVLTATYWIYKMKIVISIVDEPDDQTAPMRVAPSALRARGGWKPPQPSQSPLVGSDRGSASTR